jgi:hypothetical protein
VHIRLPRNCHCRTGPAVNPRRTGGTFAVVVDAGSLVELVGFGVRDGFGVGFGECLRLGLRDGVSESEEGEEREYEDGTHDNNVGLVNWIVWRVVLGSW